MTKHQLQLEHATLYFSKTGNGERMLIAFHGFGQTGDAFKALADALSDQYTIYLFDLFFHGNSEWSDDEQPLEKAFWSRLMKKFLRDQSIQSFSVIGFSIGAKFALATLEAFPERTNEIFLLAPDGIKTSLWYRLATYPYVFRKLFKSMILKPERFKTLANAVFRLGLIDKGILRFTQSQMDTEDKRARVYYSWIVFRHLKFNLSMISQIIDQNNIRMVMVVGKSDNVITAKKMKRMSRKIKKLQFEVVNSGHTGVIEASIPVLTGSIYSSAGKI